MHRVSKGGAPDHIPPRSSPPGWLCRGRIEAQRLLAADWGVAADVWSVTRWNELRREAMDADEGVLRGEAAREPYVTNACARVAAVP